MTKRIEKSNKPKFGIHTIEVRAYGLEEKLLSDKTIKCISGGKLGNPQLNNDVPFYRLKLNLNKYEQGFNSLEEFEKNLVLFMEDLNIPYHEVRRVDLSYDYYTDNYNELHKIHKTICALIAISNNLSNRYESRDFLSLNHLTTRAENKYMEFENYNKALESNYQSDAFNRIEMREKGLSQINKPFQGYQNIISKWEKRLDIALQYYERLQEQSNEYLKTKWEIEKLGISIDEFIRKYSNNIFTRKQLQDFFVSLGFNANEYKNFIRRNKCPINFISKTQLEKYIKELKREMKQFYKK